VIWAWRFFPSGQTRDSSGSYTAHCFALFNSFAIRVASIFITRQIPRCIKVGFLSFQGWKSSKLVFSCLLTRDMPPSSNAAREGNKSLLSLFYGNGGTKFPANDRTGRRRVRFGTAGSLKILQERIGTRSQPESISIGLGRVEINAQRRRP
jgi:hypothetical protein